MGVSGRHLNRLMPHQPQNHFQRDSRHDQAAGEAESGKQLQTQIFVFDAIGQIKPVRQLTNRRLEDVSCRRGSVMKRSGRSRSPTSWWACSAVAGRAYDAARVGHRRADHLVLWPLRVPHPLDRSVLISGSGPCNTKLLGACGRLKHQESAAGLLRRRR